MTRLGFGLGFSRRQTFRAADVTIVDQIATNGTTFTFSAPRPAGQYANGDWWVLGPVSITSISPASTVQASGVDGNGTTFTNRAVHGAMVNPGNRSYAPGGLTGNNIGNGVRQGFDGIGQGVSGIAYTSADNVDPGATGAPVTLTSGSVVKFVSALTNIPVNRRPVGLDMVVLTVVDSIPRAGDLRPGVSRARKPSNINSSQFNLGVFRNLAPPASAPSFATALSWVDRYVEAAFPDFLTNTSLKGANNHPEYGQDVANQLHPAMLCLHLNSFSAEQKRILLCHMATIADDFVARAEEGSITQPIGGGNSMKKALIVICAAALGRHMPASWQTFLAAANNNRWAEDGQIFNVAGRHIGLSRASADGRPRSAYTYRMLGSADWIEQPTGNGIFAGSNWNAFYRDIVSYSVYGGALAVELTTGGKALWQNDSFWRYYDTVFLRRFEGSPGNQMTTFVRDMAAAYRPAKTSAPVLLEAGIKNTEIWLRYDQALNELATAPAASSFAVSVNGSPATINTVSIWRQNAGLLLASPVTGNDVVTISYIAPGTNPLRSVDGVNVPGLTNQPLVNRTDRVGGPNAEYPVIEFTAGVRRQLLGGGIGASSSVGTIALMKFRFPALPASDVEIIGNSNGIPGFRIFLTAGGQLELRLADPSTGASLARVRHNTSGLAANTDYDILMSVDLTLASASAGFNCFVNNVATTIQPITWVQNGTAGWGRTGTAGTFLNFSNFTFRLGALWVNTAARLDLTNSAVRALFNSATGGNLDILTQGDGITAARPGHFAVGSADQWNDGSGINRGSGNGRWFPVSGLVTQVSGGEWI